MLIHIYYVIFIILIKMISGVTCLLVSRIWIVLYFDIIVIVVAIST